MSAGSSQVWLRPHTDALVPPRQAKERVGQGAEAPTHQRGPDPRGPGQVQGGGGGGGLQAEGIDHLGHTYLPNKTVRLKTQSLSIVYMLNGKNRKSVDFHTFQGSKIWVEQ